ncbi:putative peptidoglycan binding protein [Tepidibacillus fermentans]|uniref:Putative peptidoglycan binding protein n=1 Tax=Tepidibacillus fermentans TaxID=1281767 RepID=A0A4R3KH60_9BACI|nr:putative peptidoglycan binding protein [Tepidibacillus fermentans]
MAGWIDHPQSLNRYVYVNNNPLAFIDPTGRQAESSNWTGQILKRGDEGPFVSDLQTMLKNVGFSPGPIDGNFGPLTEGAVIDFQRYAHITVDGIAGPQTYRALVKYGGLGGSTGGESGRQEVTPPPPTKEEIIAMRSSYFRSVAGVRQPYDVQNNVTVQSRYVYHQSTPSRYGFDFKAGYSLKKLPKWKKFRLPSSKFMA